MEYITLLFKTFQKLLLDEYMNKKKTIFHKEKVKNSIYFVYTNILLTVSLIDIDKNLSNFIINRIQKVYKIILSKLGTIM